MKRKIPKFKSFSYFTNKDSISIINKQIIKRINTQTLENKNKKNNYI